MVAGNDGAQPRAPTDNGGNMGTATRRGTNVHGRGFSDDLHLLEKLLGTEEFFELWEEKHFSVVSIFDDQDVRNAFQRTDFPTTAFSNRKVVGHLDGEDNTSLR